MRRAREGDDRAFELLYHRYHRRITAYIFGMVHDHGRAEDVAQDVFVSALRRMRDTDRPIAFKPWLYEIAKNACIDQFRRSRRSEEVSYDADEGMGAADYGRLVSEDAVPETRLESKQSMEDLRGAFGGLSEAHHQILVMRELEGLSYREIGDRLGMSRASVESTLFRARRRLTEEYEELVSGARCQRIQAIIAGAETAVVGARDERRLARHVSHCQPCRRQARLAGLDIPVTADRPVRERIAALIPLPLFLRKRWSGGSSHDAIAGTSHLSGLAQWSAQLGCAVDPGWVKAAAAAATVAVAGVGVGVASRPAGPGRPTSNLSALVSGLGGSGSDARGGTSAQPARSVQAATRTDLSHVVAVAGRTTATGAPAVTSATPSPSAARPASGNHPSATATKGVATQLASGSVPSTPSDSAPQPGDVGKVPAAVAPQASASAPQLPSSAPDPTTALTDAQKAAGAPAVPTVTTPLGLHGGG